MASNIQAHTNLVASFSQEVHFPILAGSFSASSLLMPESSWGYFSWRVLAPSGDHGHIVMGEFHPFAWPFPMSRAHFPSTGSWFIFIHLEIRLGLLLSHYLLFSPAQVAKGFGGRAGLEACSSNPFAPEGRKEPALGNLVSRSGPTLPTIAGMRPFTEGIP